MERCTSCQTHYQQAAYLSHRSLVIFTMCSKVWELTKVISGVSGVFISQSVTRQVGECSKLNMWWQNSLILSTTTPTAGHFSYFNQHFKVWHRATKFPYPGFLTDMELLHHPVHCNGPIYMHQSFWKQKLPHKWVAIFVKLWPGKQSGRCERLSALIWA